MFFGLISIVTFITVITRKWNVNILKDSLLLFIYIYIYTHTHTLVC